MEIYKFRSIYFALMKHEVVEGRLTVELEKYIGLAAHSLQGKVIFYFVNINF